MFVTEHILYRSVNPIPTRGQIIPTTLLQSVTIEISTCKGSLIVRSYCIFLKNQESTISICKNFEADKLARLLGSGDTDRDSR